MDYNRPSSPMPDLGLPPPFIVQFDEASQTPYFVNTQTGQSQWTHPVDGSSFHPSSSSDPAGYGGDQYASPATGTRGMGDSGGQGHAASFYGSSGPAPDTYTASGSSAPYNSNDPNAAPGDRGMGSKIAMGGLAYLAYKMYQKHQKQNQHQSYGSYGKPQQSYSGGNSFMGTALGAGAGGMLGNYLMGGGKREMGPDNGQSRDYLSTPMNQTPYGGTSTPGYEQPTGHQSGWMPPPPPDNGGWSAPPLPANGFDSFNQQPATGGPIISYGNDANGSYGGSSYGQTQYGQNQYGQQQGYGQNPVGGFTP